MKRLHCAFISATVSVGLSSILMSLALSVLPASVISFHCWSESLPVRRASPGTIAARERSLVASCSRLISSENTATFFFSVMPTWRAIFSAILVLPMPGRAAMRISSDLLRPSVLLSRSGRPVGRPGILLPEAEASLIVSNTFCMTVPIGTRPPTFLPCLRANTRLSAVSRIASAAPSP